jgi:plastocyanin
VDRDLNFYPLGRRAASSAGAAVSLLNAGLKPRASVSSLPQSFTYIHWCLLVVALLAFGFAGCGGSQNQKSASSVSIPTRRIDPATTGSISGTVTLEGSPPVSKPIDMSAEPYCDKLNAAPVFPQQVVTGNGGTLANVVVYIKDFPADYIVDAPPAAATLSQRGCMYDPHVVALRTGQTLEIKNEDQATHNILAIPNQNPRWNRSETPAAPPIEETFAVPELAIPLRCNVHPWMKSYVFVFSHPYFAVTGKDGQFELKNLPAGNYTLAAWQEKYGTQETTITVTPQKSNVTNFKFNASNATGN